METKEWESYVAGAFSRLDADGDGFIELEELISQLPADFFVGWVACAARARGSVQRAHFAAVSREKNAESSPVQARGGACLQSFDAPLPLAQGCRGAHRRGEAHAARGGRKRGREDQVCARARACA